jgi:hypothetical protein
MQILMENVLEYTRTQGEAIFESLSLRHNFHTINHLRRSTGFSRVPGHLIAMRAGFLGTIRALDRGDRVFRRPYSRTRPEAF